MDITQIKMTKQSAWNAFQQYKKHCGEKPNSRDKAIMEAYKSLSKGRNVINLLSVIKATGLFMEPNTPNHGFPKLAVMRADAEKCFCSMNTDGSGYVSSANGWSRGAARIDFPRDTFVRWTAYRNGQAIIPIIPPQFRPARTMMKNYWILWEAEWKAVPKDPILLKHLSGWLYAVVASWDLTPVEQAVLGG